MTPLSPATEERLVLVFSPDQQERVRTLLVAECGENVPGWRNAVLERLRIAALKLSDGDFKKLQGDRLRQARLSGCADVGGLRGTVAGLLAVDA